MLGSAWPEVRRRASASVAPSLGACSASVAVSRHTCPGACGDCRDSVFCCCPYPRTAARKPRPREELGSALGCSAAGDSGEKSAFPQGSSPLALPPLLLLFLFVLSAVRHFSAAGTEQRGVEEGDGLEMFHWAHPAPFCARLLLVLVLFGFVSFEKKDCYGKD